MFLTQLTSEFVKRWNEEEQATCNTPVVRNTLPSFILETFSFVLLSPIQTHRLTPTIRKTFVKVLRTPALLAMFSKDPLSMGYAQGSLRLMAALEPGLVMPELLERAYGGLEVVNETHRTTAVLSMLSGISQTLVSERAWVGGQKHLVPLLELCIPGIDLVWFCLLRDVPMV